MAPSSEPTTTPSRAFRGTFRCCARRRAASSPGFRARRWRTSRRRCHRNPPSRSRSSRRSGSTQPEDRHVLWAPPATGDWPPWVRSQCCERPSIRHIPQRVPRMGAAPTSGRTGGRGPVALRAKEIGSPTATRARASDKLARQAGNVSRPTGAGKPGRSANWMSVATNCRQRQQRLVSERLVLNDSNYDGLSNTNGWVQQGGNSGYPRVVDLFLHPVPGAQGWQVPILGFASFYVMNWRNRKRPPCPTFDADGDPATRRSHCRARPARDRGVFVETG